MVTAATGKGQWFAAVMALVLLLQGSGTAPAARAGQADRNIALGKPVVFAPDPDYPLTSAGGGDATDLTEGKFSISKTDQLRFDRNCVGYSYAGQVQLSIDLGQVETDPRSRHPVAGWVASGRHRFATVGGCGRQHGRRALVPCGLVLAVARGR